MYQTSETSTMMPSIGSSNDIHQLTALGIRLDTRPLLDDIELWLRGSRIVAKEDSKGGICYEKVSFGRPKANELGIQSILSVASTVFNSHFVQGNWSEQRYEMFIEEFHDSLLWTTMINLYDWGIDESDYEIIVDHLVNSIQGFASRLIGNKERESYENTVRTIESTHVKESPNQGLSLFKK